MIKNYSFFSKLFHKITLGNKYNLNLFFDLKKFFYLNKNWKYNNNEHIFICGLARSGSTILLNYLTQNQNYTSLTYNDVPMILSPNLYKYFKKKFKNPFKKKISRYHRDGLSIDLDTPEAFEEVFWKFIFDNNYINNNFLENNIINNYKISEFKKFLSLILIKNNKNLYISKNNNNILRINFLKKYLNNSKFLIPFRHPLQQSISLLEQHNNFCEIQKNNLFALKYMDYIGHHEFGINQKSFKLKENYKNTFNKESLNFWLSDWHHVYSNIFFQNRNDENVYFFNFEKFCETPDFYIKKFKLSEIKNKIFIKKPEEKKINNLDFNKDLLNKCSNLYYEMLKV